MRSSIVGLYTSMSSSEKFQNILVDSIFHTKHESDVELWFQARNETQNNQFTFDNNVEIYHFFDFDPFLRPGIQKRRKPDTESNRASFALSIQICR